MSLGILFSKLLEPLLIKQVFQLRLMDMRCGQPVSDMIMWRRRRRRGQRLDKYEFIFTSEVLNLFSSVRQWLSQAKYAMTAFNSKWKYDKLASSFVLHNLLLIKPFIWWRSSCRRHRAFLKFPIPDTSRKCDERLSSHGTKISNLS